MKHLSSLIMFLILASLACSLTDAPTPTVENLSIKTATRSPVPNEAVATPANVNDYAIFSINVQDFSYPAQSAAVLDKIISLHEKYNLPVDIYLTDVMAKIYAEQDAMWTMYEQTVIYVASQQGHIAPVNLPMVLDMLR